MSGKTFPVCVSPTLKQQVLAIIARANRQSPSKGSQDFPGPLPKSLGRLQLSEVSTHDYWVCEKSDGERYLLFVSTHAAYFIDRKWNFYTISSGPTSLLSTCFATNGDTLLDGEWIQTRELKTPVFMLFDGVCIDGAIFANEPTSKRLRVLTEKVIAPFRVRRESTRDVSLPFDVRVKEMETKQNVANVLNQLHDEGDSDDGDRRIRVYRSKARRISNVNDGLVFTREDDDYFQGKGGLFKMKWSHTVDFLCRPEGSKVKLFAGGPNDTFICVGALADCSESEMRLLNTCASTTAPIIECMYSAQLGRWVLLVPRLDKSKPNYISVLTSTLQHIIDNITEKDVLQLANVQI